MHSPILTNNSHLRTLSIEQDSHFLQVGQGKRKEVGKQGGINIHWITSLSQIIHDQFSLVFITLSAIGVIMEENTDV